MEKDNNYEEINLEEYYVAFLDILGYKNFILDKSFEEELEFLKNIKKAFNESIEIIKKGTAEKSELSKVKFKTFSDNIVLAIPKDNISIGAFLCFIKLIRTLSYLMIIKFGLFLRGGISEGNYFQNDDISFGSALVNSYLLETKAQYPRIIVKKEIIDEFLKRGYENRYFSIQRKIILSENSSENDLKSLYKETEKIILSMGFFHCDTLAKDASEILSFLLDIMHNLDSKTFKLFIKQLNNPERMLFELEKKYCDLANESTTLFFKDFLSVYSEEESFYTLNTFEKNTSLLYKLSHEELTSTFFLKYPDGCFSYPVKKDKEGNLIYQYTMNEFMMYRTDSIEELKEIRNTILICIEKYSCPANEKILLKYEWLKVFFNNNCSKILKKKFITESEYKSLII
ncbi:MAG: hypothetical protein RR945_04050 [Erysipelotrichaceae bacterium]